jgi:hypothetical protein
MPNTTISPNMNMPVPVVGVDPGPTWASDINSCLSIIDSHTHTAGQGVPITPSAININSDLSWNGFNLTGLRSVRFNSHTAALATAADLGCLYEVGVDLYYNDGAGNQIRITQSGTVSGSTGTITGLPSGTASASFAAGTFTFQSATSTPASLAVGPTTIAQAVASGKGVTISANNAQASNYNLTLPTALPSLQSAPVSDNSGNLSFTPLVSNTFTPTVSWSRSSGDTTTFTVLSQQWIYTRIGNVVIVSGLVSYSTSGISGGSAYNFQASIPVATASLSVYGGMTANNPQGSSKQSNTLDANSTTGVIQNEPDSYSANANAEITVNYTYVVS